ncbi:hypothetical protein Fmac_032715 [Flemingia macrophylla]|uniref:cellulase n=1 Tax=Flemingia macrophylla TaxID=520843 RepID=A0ABD1L5R3_9FABA
MTTSRGAYKINEQHPGLAGETAASLAFAAIAFRPYNSSYSSLLLVHAKQIDSEILLSKVLLEGKAGSYADTLKQYQDKADYFACACLQKNDGYNVQKTPGGLLYFTLVISQKSKHSSTVQMDKFSLRSSSILLSHRYLLESAPSLVDHMYHDFGEEDELSAAETEELRIIGENTSYWKRQCINPTEERSKGFHPLTPKEVGIFHTAALGHPSKTPIYIAVGKIYAGESHLTDLLSRYPLLMSKAKPSILYTSQSWVNPEYSLDLASPG